jgi:hypothetical protein
LSAITQLVTLTPPTVEPAVTRVWTAFELSELLEAGLFEEGGRIDLETGEVWRASTIEYFSEQEPEEAPAFEDPDRWLYVA